jgi:hypothetical protein
MNGKPRVLAFLFLLPLGLGAADAVDVDRNELQSGQQPIEFENYSGEHQVVNTLSQIRAIGGELARTFRDARGNLILNTRGGDIDRYSRIMLVDTAPSPGLAADVIELGRYAGVDHVRNLRQIVAGYIEAAYGYSQAEADELSVYITVYNAVYRKSFAKITETYNSSVVSFLDKDKIGLAPSWRDWRGATEIVIPVYDIGGGAFQIATPVILDEAVVEQLKKEPDTGISQRQLDERIQREAVAAKEQAEREVAIAKEKEERVRQERALQQEAEQKVETARRVAKAADDKAAAMRRAFAAAQEKVRVEGARLKRFEEDLATMRGEADKARRNIVVNRFGIPVQGNEEAKKKDDDAARQAAAVTRQTENVRLAEQELADLEQAIKDADAEALRANEALVP